MSVDQSIWSMGGRTNLLDPFKSEGGGGVGPIHCLCGLTRTGLTRDGLTCFSTPTLDYMNTSMRMCLINVKCHVCLCCYMSPISYDEHVMRCISLVLFCVFLLYVLAIGDV